LPSSVTSKAAQLDFNKAIIDATSSLVCAYKLNSAFYEAEGSSGIEQLRASVAYINETCSTIPVILDAKRADIGNTNNGYVEFAFDYLKVDAITLHPYLGEEALRPFLDRTDKGLIILCRTSNEGSGEFQDLLVDGKPLYQRVAENVSKGWNKNGNCSLVVGATYTGEMKIVRQIAGDDMPFLVPGIGAQGGDIEAVLKNGLGKGRKGLIINSARSIIFASSGPDFAEAAKRETEALHDTINKYRRV
jgi:orotidine-5'-phosphate decarboxylase